MDRECTKCIYHISGQCTKWECNGTVTVEDVRNKSIDDFAKWLIDKKVDDYTGIVDLVAEYKGGGENE